MVICLYTFGCKLNQVESRNLEESLRKSGLRLTSWPNKASLYIINTCSVTAKAEREARQIIYQIKKRFSRALILVTGCFINQNNKLVDFWQRDKKKVAQLSPKITKLSKIKCLTDTIGLSLPKEKTRIFLKIQDGCDKFCAYCIVPYLRGGAKSRSPKAILSEIKKYEKQGAKEIVLVGTNIGEYHHKLKTQNSKLKTIDLIRLLKLILVKTSIPRIRLSSLWPSRVNKNLIDLFKKNERICPHFHLSIQSASDKLLKLMGRDYTKKEIAVAIKKIKKISDAVITADFIVGFPNETERDFQETYNFIKEHQIFRCHVFRYSVRPKTRAGLMLQQVPEKIKKERSRKLIALNKNINRNLRIKSLGKIYPVLFEQKQSQFWQGLTPNYLKVFVRSKKDLRNQIYHVRLMKFFQDGIFGKINLTVLSFKL